MGIRINQNIMAMNSYRNLTTSESSLSKSLEKLSSGFRINKAADDASGLVISEGLRSQVRGLKMAIRNTQDGVSVVQTAEGALTEVHSLLQRIRELAVQASSTGSSDPAARDAAQAEVAQLIDEVDRIATTTRFGGQQLLNGTYGATIADDGTAAVAGVAATVTGAASPLANFQVDFSLTPERYVLALDGGPGFVVDVTTSFVGNLTAADIATDIQADLDTALVAAGYAGGDVVATVAEPTAGNFTVTLTRNSTATGNALQVSYDGTAGGATFFESWFGTGATVLSDEGSGPVSAVAGDFGTRNGSAAVQGTAVPTAPLLANYQGGFAEAFQINLNGQGFIDVTLDANTTGLSREEFQDVLQAAVDDALVANGDGAAGDVVVNVIEDGNGDWRTELRTRETGTGITLTAQASGVDSLFADLFGTPVTSAGDDTAGGVFQVGADAGETILVNIRDIQSTSIGLETNGVILAGDSIQDLDIANNASGALAVIDAAITQVSTQRGDLGAIQNRFEHTIANLSVTVENLSASESRIRDTDMAEEMMSFTRAQILQQAGTAMLAQANAVPQSVLQLLQ